MESRGLGRSEDRTFYKQVELNAGDWLFFAVAALVYLLIVLLLVKLDLFRYSFAAIQ